MLQALKGFDDSEKGKVLQLAKAGMHHEESSVYGWHNQWGATGISSSATDISIFPKTA